MRNSNVLTDAELHSLLSVNEGVKLSLDLERFYCEVLKMDDDDLSSIHGKLSPVRAILGVGLDGDAASVCDEFAYIMALLPSVLRDRYGSGDGLFLLAYALLAYLVDDEYTRRQHAPSGHNDNAQEASNGKSR
ncbi:MAG: hypothetical protein J6D54_05645 [Olsenella sp.]|nr:hypothetical protein [Olsenella sp.]